MQRNVIIIGLVLAAFVAPALLAGGAQETGEEEFSARLETALTNSDFTEGEAQAIADEVAARSAGDIDEADAEVVARALSLAKEEDAELDSEENAQLALELAQNAVRLEEENYEKTEVAQATTEAVRTMLGQIEEWKSGDKSENLGEIVRSTVSAEAKKAAQKRTSEKSGKGKEKASEATSSTPADENSASSAGEKR